jgi:hypothetical protein
MNQDTIVQTSAQLSSASGIRLWVGVGLTGLVVLFLTFDGIAKVMRVAPVLEACRKLGIAQDLIAGIGLLLLVCTVLYAIPRTAILGAILLTGYLGGATAVSGGCSKRAFPHRFRVRLWRAGLDRIHFARTSAARLDSSLAMIG